MRPLVPLLLVVALPSVLFGHGGTYRGPGGAPGDTVAPSSGGSGGASTTPATPTGGSGSSSGSSGSNSTPSGSNTNSQSSAPAAGADATRWQTWWGFNKEPYLALKAAVFHSNVLAGSDEAFVARDGQPTRDQLLPSMETIRREVVPALQQALSEERSNDIVSGALVALAKIGETNGATGSAALIARFLLHSNQEIAETAALALGILGESESTDVLLEVLRRDERALARRFEIGDAHVTERTQAFAAYGLGLLARERAGGERARIVNALVERLRGERAAAGQAEIPVACVIALGLAPLDSDLFTPLPADMSTRPARVTTLEEQVLWLAATLGDASVPSLVRAHAPESIARLLATAPQSAAVREAAARAMLARLGRASGEDPDVRVGCVIALGAIGDADLDKLDLEIRRALTAVATESREPQLEHFALISLAQCASRGGSGADAFAALDPTTPGAREFLLEQFGRGVSATRCYAALAIGVLERAALEARQPVSESALAALRTALAEAKSPDQIGAFALALGIARDDRAVGALREKLEWIAEADARGYVAVALGLVGDTGSIARIQEIVLQSRFRPELMRQAAIALGLLGDKSIVPQLIDMLANASSLSSQAAIASALGQIGDARSIAPLVAMLKDRESRTDLARAFAGVALGIAADRHAEPWSSRISTQTNYRATTATLYSPDTGTGLLDIL